MPSRSEGDGEGSTRDRPRLVDLALDAAVVGAQSGDEDAVRHLYRALQPKILSYLRAMVGETDAEDVASEAWSRIARDLRSFRGDGAAFKAWTITIARHRAIDHLRRRRPSTPLAPQEIPHWPATDDTERDAIEAIGTAAALAIIAELPPDQAQVILLRVVVGLDAPTVAKVLGKRPGAVRMAAHRGLRNLSKRLRQPAAGSGGEENPPSPVPGRPPPPLYRCVKEAT